MYFTTEYTFYCHLAKKISLLKKRKLKKTYPLEAVSFKPSLSNACRVGVCGSFRYILKYHSQILQVQGLKDQIVFFPPRN